MEQQTNQASLYKKMAHVMATLRRLPKSGDNSQHKYKYVTSEDVLDAVRGAMADANLAFLVSIIETRQEVIGQSKSGNATLKTMLQLAMTIADGDTGESNTCTWFAEAIDWGDKGINKALTTGVKYFLLKTFLVSAGDEVDPDSEPGTIATIVKGQPAMSAFNPANIKSYAELAQAAVQRLGYDHPNHVTNTLKDETNGKAKGMSYVQLWDILVKHKQAKKSTELDAQAAAESGDEPSGETMQFDLDAIPT